MKEYIRNFENFVLPTYRRDPVVFCKGKGSYIYDTDGKKYLDFFPGWGVGILGYAHPRIIKALKDQAAQLINLPNNFYHPYQGLLAKEIIRYSFPGKVFFANSGAEAIEGAIKLMRAYGSASGRYKIITFHDSFHGRTMGALSATAQEKYQKPFKPVLPGFSYVPINDFSAFEKAVDAQTIGVILEPIQGEGGINVFNGDFIRRLRAYCSERDIVLGFDEVQTGMGRTGKMFGYQHYGIEPDVMMLAKGLGAGVPISALVVSAKFAGVLQPGMHASTFGGGPLVCRVALEVFKIIKEEKLLHKAVALGTIIGNRLGHLKKKYPVIKDFRGKGMMWGVELESDGASYFKSALEHKLIINCTHQTVLRIMPALTIDRPLLEKGLDILESVFEKLK